MTTKVKLRQKPISEGRLSLYLDFYPAIENPKTGKTTRRDFLGLYIFEKPKTPLDKLHNKETLQLAEQLRQKFENRLNKPEVYTEFEKQQLKLKERGKLSFIDYFKQLRDKRKASNYDNWVAAFKYFDTFTNGHLTFAELNEKLCNDFKDYLLNVKSIKNEKSKLANNSALSYFNKFKAALKQAHKDGYLQDNLNAKIATIKEVETRRDFLTLVELNSLVKTHCTNPLLKRAALFSAMTGLRFIDIKNLAWKDIEYIKNNGYFIKFKQQKTKGIETMPISEQAFALLGERKEPSDQVFEGLTYSAYSNKHLYQWIGSAGITKDITFHCFRHTYATLQLSAGTDIYTLSKMLGHRELKTTQIYAKIIDDTKRQASKKIVLEFPL